MVPVLGLFATAAVVGAGAALGWRVAREHILPTLTGKAPPGGQTARPKIIDGEYVEIAAGGDRTGSRGRGDGDRR